MVLIKQITAFVTLSRKEITRVLRIWSQTILPPGITMTLYFVIFGRLIGAHIPAIRGITYMQYITPGLIIMPVITAAYMNTAVTFFSAKFQRSIEEIMVSPMPNYIIISGYIMGGIFRALAIACVVFVVSMFFIHIRIYELGLTLVTLILASILFSLIGFTNGVFAKKFDSAFIVPTFVLTPLTYLGGVFYSINLLPHFWRQLSLFNPIFHIIDLFRYSMLGIKDANIGAAFVVIVIFIVIFFGINLYLLRKGVGVRT